MEFRLLGPIEASHESTAVPVGRRQERLLLTLLLLSAPAPVPADRLTAWLWPDDPPAGPRSTLHTYVGRLRHVLEPFGVRIERVADAYRVRGDYTVDAEGFRRLATTRDTDPAEQARLWREALAMWRGELPADGAGAELTDLRLAVAERYARLRLDAGEQEIAVADLLGLARDHPTREVLVASVMTGLHRCGRRADALDLYARACAALAELGVAPGPELTTLRDRIENADPALNRPAAPKFAVLVRDQWLPWHTSGHPALEFCNTCAGWTGRYSSRSDWLRGYPALAVWAGHVDLADDWVVTRLLNAASADPVAAAKVLTDARELRAGLYASLTQPDDAVAFKAVATVAEAAVRHSTFVRGDDGLGRWRVAPGTGLRLPVYAAARSAAESLADPRRFAVRACPGAKCGWLFLDEHNRRRYCSLATCGAHV